MCGNMYVPERRKTVSCGDGEKGGIKLWGGGGGLTYLCSLWLRICVFICYGYKL